MKNLKTYLIIVILIALPCIAAKCNPTATPTADKIVFQVQRIGGVKIVPGDTIHVELKKYDEEYEGDMVLDYTSQGFKIRERPEPIHNSDDTSLLITPLPSGNSWQYSWDGGIPLFQLTSETNDEGEVEWVLSTTQYLFIERSISPHQ